MSEMRRVKVDMYNITDTFQGVLQSASKSFQYTACNYRTLTHIQEANKVPKKHPPVDIIYKLNEHLVTSAEYLVGIWRLYYVGS
jgi:hypothetical protein